MRIKDFQSDLRLDKDGLLAVREQITIDFERSIRNGFFRHIAISPHQRTSSATNVRLIQVTNESGYPVAHQESRKGSDWSIRVGEDSKIMSGTRVFYIVYLVQDAVAVEPKANKGTNEQGPTSGDEKQDGRVEFAWHVTGHDWPYPIDNLQCRFFPPEGTSVDRIDAECLRGASDFKAHERAGKCKIEMTENHVVYRAASLKAGEELDVVARLPEGTIVPHSVLGRVSWIWQDWWTLFAVPLFTGCALFVYWLFFGRDGAPAPEATGGTGPPDGLTPAEVGTLIDERCDVPDVLSTLIDLCARGYIRICEKNYNGILMMSDKDYEFTRMSPSGHLPALKLHETLFMDAMFGVVCEKAYLSQLQGVFYPYIANIERAIWTSLLATRLFVRDPDQDRRKFHWIAALMFMGSILSAMFLGPEARASSVGTIIGAVMVAVWSNAMPARTSKGSCLLNQCRAFQRFLSNPDRIKVQAMAGDDPSSVFGRYLSYAMVLGATDQWASAFRGLLHEAPCWYLSLNDCTADSEAIPPGDQSSQIRRSDRSSDFDAEAFLCRLGVSMHVIQTALYTQPRRGVSSAHADSEDTWSHGVAVIRSGFRGRR